MYEHRMCSLAQTASPCSAYVCPAANLNEQNRMGSNSILEQEPWKFFQNNLIVNIHSEFHGKR